MRLVLLCTCLLPLLGCTSQPDETATTDRGSGETDAAAQGAGDPVEVLRSFATEFMARAEHDADRVVVRHLLVSFAGRGVPGVDRSQAEAEQMAAELWQRIQAGEDFAQLVRDHSDDSPEGVYTMLVSGGRPPETYNRGDMVAAFGDTGWRLEVGEFGVAPYDPAASKFGWHLVQRLE